MEAPQNANAMCRPANQTGRYDLADADDDAAEADQRLGVVAELLTVYKLGSGFLYKAEVFVLSKHIICVRSHT